MTIDTLIMLSGALVAVLPFLGFPNSWDSALFFLAGVFVIALGIVVRRRDGLKSDTREERNFTEQRPSLSAEIANEAPRFSVQPQTPPLHSQMSEAQKPISATASAVVEKKPHVSRTKTHASSRLASVEPVISPVQRVAAPQAAPRTRSRRSKAAAHEAS